MESKPFYHRDNNLLVDKLVLVQFTYITIVFWVGAQVIIDEYWLGKYVEFWIMQLQVLEYLKK